MTEYNIDNFLNNSLVANHKIRTFSDRFGYKHLIFACHAAFPLAFTPQLLYAIWSNFQFDNKGNQIRFEWISVADFLLSPLCQEVGKELFEIETQIRDELLDILRNAPNYGDKRIDQVAQFILAYSKRKLDQFREREFNLSLRWSSLAQLHPDIVAREIAQEISKIKKLNTTEWTRYYNLANTLLPSLEIGNQSALLLYLRGMREVSRGNLNLAESFFQQLPIEKGKIVISGVLLAVPNLQELADLEEAVVAIPPLEPIQFETAQISQASKSFNLQRWNINSFKKSCLIFKESLSSYVQPISMVKISRGDFTLGSPEKEGYLREKPRCHISIPEFFLSAYPISQEQWRYIALRQKIKINLNPNPSEFKGAHYPIEKVTWFEAVEFCERLQLLTGRPYRLPSEAEWEFACRAGTTTPFFFGETLSPELANYDSSKRYRSGPKAKPRMQPNLLNTFKYANFFGLYDMHGNVWEWCQDYWFSNYQNMQLDGSPRISLRKEAHRVVRGGSWIDEPQVCRSAYRNGVPPNNKILSIGFRVALSRES